MSTPQYNYPALTEALSNLGDREDLYDQMDSTATLLQIAVRMLTPEQEAEFFRHPVVTSIIDEYQNAPAEEVVGIVSDAGERDRPEGMDEDDI